MGSAPSAVLRTTTAGCLDVAAPITAIGGRNDGDETTLVGNVRRIQPEEAARRCDLVRHGDGRVLDTQTDPSVGGELAQRGGKTAAGQVAHRLNVDPRPAEIRETCGGAVSDRTSDPAAVLAACSVPRCRVGQSGH